MENKVKILGLPGDDSACSRYRVVWPLEAMKRAGFCDYYVPEISKDGNDRFVKATWEDGGVDPDDPDFINNYDIVILQRQPNEDITTLLSLCKEKGIKSVFDIDDGAFSIPKWNPNYLVWGTDKPFIRYTAKQYLKYGDLPGSLRGKTPDQIAEEAPTIRQGLIDNLRLADMVTTTTPALKEEYRYHNDNIKILPNQMNPEFWSGLEPIEHEDVWIGWAGSSTHLEDLKILKQPMRYVLNRYKNVKFVLVGFTDARHIVFKDFPDEWFELFQWTPLGEYHDYVASLDIVLAPSKDCDFNRGKSDIRAMESWLCKRPVVSSHTTYGKSVKDSGGGLVARTNGSRTWAKAIETLVKNKSLREQMGQDGYKYVMNRRTYDNNVYRWMKAYQELLDG